MLSLKQRQLPSRKLRIAASLFLLSLPLALDSCAGSSTITDGQKALISICGGYAQTLGVLTVFKQQGKLSNAILADVDQTNQIVGPLCDPAKPLPTDATSAINTVRPLITKLAGYITGAK